MRRPVWHAIATLALAAIYVVVARLGLMMDAVAGFASLVWPPTGIALVALIRFGPQFAPGIALGAFVVNAWAGAPLGAAAGIAIGNTLEAIAGAALLQRLAFRPLLDRMRDVLALVAAALLGAIVAASVGVASLYAFGVVEPGGATAAWRAWWLGDVMGVLVVAPFLFALVSPVRPERRRFVEGIAVLLALGTSTFVAFGGWPSIDLPHVRLPYVVFPSLIWASLRFGARGAATGVLVVSAMAIATTAAGYGAFAAGATLAESLFGLQAFMGIVAITILLLGAVSDERDTAIQQRQQFLEIISHELKNPLSSIQLSTDSLLRTDVPAPVAKRAAIIKRASERMGSLVQDLLDASAIEAGRLAVTSKHEDACAIVSEALDTLVPLAAAKSQTLERDVPEGPVPLACDRDRIVQVLVNIAGNAIKFAPEHSTIRVRLRVEGSRVCLTIADDGPGMSAEQVAHLFERYWQASRDSRKGRGLGLFISKGLVDAHRGELVVESHPGAGTTFHVRLPCA